MDKVTKNISINDFITTVSKAALQLGLETEHQRELKEKTLKVER